MARGYPDFFGYSVFPYYGGFFYDQDSGNLASGVGFTEILRLDTKAVCHRLLLFGTVAAAFLNCRVQVTIDGEQFGPESIDNLLGYGVFGDKDMLLNIMYRVNNITNQYFGVRIGNEISFGQSFVVEMENTTGVNMQWLTYLTYHKVI